MSAVEKPKKKTPVLVETGENLAKLQPHYRERIATGKHLSRMEGIAYHLAEMHSQGKYLDPDSARSVKVEIDLLSRLVAKTLPDLAVSRIDVGEDKTALSGVVVLPMIKDQQKNDE